MEELSEKQIQIYYGELNSKKRSLGAAYVLLVFLGAVGGHKFYLGSVNGGAAYLFWSFVTLCFHPAGFILLICFLIDLISLPVQVANKNNEIGAQILTDIKNRSRGFKDF